MESIFSAYSYWELHELKKQNDLVVIGAGISGCVAAISYKKQFPNKKVIVLEKESIGSAASSRNAGFACIGSPSELISDIELYGQKAVEDLLRKKWFGLQILLKMVGGSAINFKKHGGWEVFENDQDPDISYTKAGIEDLNRLLKKVTSIDQYYKAATSPLPGFANFAWNIGFEGQLNSGRLIRNIRLKMQNLGIEFVSGVDVTSISGELGNFSISSNQLGDIPSKLVLVTTNAFATSLLPTISVTPGRGLVKVSKPLKHIFPKGNYHFKRGYVYFRNLDDNRLLLGGFRNLDFEGERSFEPTKNSVIDLALDSLANSHISIDEKVQWEYEWAGFMGFTENHQPFTGMVQPGLFVCAGMNGMGVALAPFVARDTIKQLSKL